MGCHYKSLSAAFSVSVVCINNKFLIGSSNGITTVNRTALDQTTVDQNNSKSKRRLIEKTKIDLLV